MSDLVLNIDKKLAELFDFVVNYAGDDKNDLFLEWKSDPMKGGITFTQVPTDKASVELEVSEKDKIEFEVIFKLVLKTITPDIWFENRVRNYCIKRLSQIQQELRGQPVTGGEASGGGNYPPNPGIGRMDKIPDDYWHYLIDYGRQNSKSSIASQYEIAFRCRIVPGLRRQFGVKLFEIDDLDYLAELGQWIKENEPNNTDASAFNNYMKYKRGNRNRVL